MARPHLSHLGIFVRDIDAVEHFYTTVFGLYATDRGVGKTFKNHLVFLTGDARQHHQLVLSSGRPADAPSTIMQLSFMVDSLDDLRAIKASALVHGATNMMGLNHGNAWSIYFDDPEGNKVEVYKDSPFHVPQPCGEPLDLELDDAALLAQTETLVRGLDGYMPRMDYVASLRGKLDPADAQPSFVERLAEIVYGNPGETILDYFDDPYTRGDIAGHAKGLLDALDTAGVPADASIGIIMRNRPLHVAAVLGLVAAGRPLTSIYALQSPTLMASDVQEARLAAIVAEEVDFSPELTAALAAMGSVGVALKTDSRSLGMAAGAETFTGGDDYRRGADEAGMELLSSGTTGKPKRIQFPFRLLERSVETIKAGLTDGTPEPDVVTWSFAGIAMGNVVANIMVGRYMALIDRFRIDAWLEAVRRLRPTYVTGPPAVAQMIVDANVAPEDLSSIGYFYGGSAPMPVETQQALLDRYGIATIWAYGATEFAGTVISWSHDLYKQFGTQKMGSMGKPLPGIQIRIVDAESGAELPQGEQGYLEAIVPVLGPDWIRTTDLARIDEDGFIYHLGRGDGAIMRGGFKILPETIVRTLAQHPDVLDSGVVALPDRRVGEVPGAMVQLRAGHAPEVSSETLTAYLRDHLPATYIPAVLAITDTLPRTASMKIDLGAIKERLGEQIATA
ncbi:hypothetical protein BH10PSE13_BH10PSE13_25430 [soil metagenome]